MTAFRRTSAQVDTPSPPTRAARWQGEASSDSQEDRFGSRVWIVLTLFAVIVLGVAPIGWYIGATQPERPDRHYVVDGREIRFHFGDDQRWAHPDWNDRDWPQIAWNGSPARSGIYWLRFRVSAPVKGEALPSGARITSPRAYELFWDGALLARNGVPGNSGDEEKPGRLDVLFNVPEASMGPGEHVVAMRVSSFHDWAPRGAPTYFKLDEPANIQSWKTTNALCPTAATGAMMFLTVVCGSFWILAVRRSALLWLTAMSLAAAAMQGLIVYRWLYNYPANWYFHVTMAGWWCSGLLAWCFAGFVVDHFAVPHRRWLLALLAPLLGVVAHFSPANQASESAGMLLAAFTAVLLPLGWAMRRRRPGAWIVLVGVTVSGGWFLSGWLQLDFSSQFSPALIGVTVAMALQLRIDHRAARQARLTAARLEIELLKKSLQPHFLMNTLTALAQTVEENPAGAVKLIEDLAEEFRTLSAMAGEFQVSLGRELELCRTHLRVMRARTDLDWQLTTESIDEDLPVPPALFLTLIENGFSHQRTRRGATTFSLRADAGPAGVRYTFHSPGEITAQAERVRGGTGLRYLHARLEESFPGAWSLTQSLVADGWETVIELRGPGSRRVFA